MMDELADGLWTRLRNVLIALDRVDRLESSTDMSGWIDTFQNDPDQIAATAHNWVLRAIRLASDPVNYDLLCRLQSAEMTTSQLMVATGLSRIDLSERIKELAQAGFVAQSLDTDNMQATQAAQGMVRWVEALSSRIAERARGGLTKDNPPPRPHRPIPWPRDL